MLAQMMTGVKRLTLSKRTLSFSKLLALRRRRNSNLKANVGVMVVVEMLLASMSEEVRPTSRNLASVFAGALLHLLKQAQLRVLPLVIVVCGFLLGHYYIAEDFIKTVSW